METDGNRHENHKDHNQSDLIVRCNEAVQRAQKALLVMEEERDGHECHISGEDSDKKKNLHKKVVKRISFVQRTKCEAQYQSQRFITLSRSCDRYRYWEQMKQEQQNVERDLGLLEAKEAKKRTGLQSGQESGVAGRRFEMVTAGNVLNAVCKDLQDDDVQRNGGEWPTNLPS